MIIVKLTGGLGNQMFQYAAGYARANREKTTLKLDLSVYSGKSKRPFALDHFTITAQKTSNLEILYSKYLNPNTYMQGDFQSEEHFKYSAATLRKEFSLREPLDQKYPDLIKNIHSSNSIAVHIRRMDYLDKQHRYIILTLEYYKKAIDIISQKIPHPKYFFFSDDITWVKENISYPPDSIFLSHADYEDLILMSMCKHQIIANSTFSWWAAWLNNNPDKIIITPYKWFTNSYTQNENLLPASWIQL